MNEYSVGDIKLVVIKFGFVKNGYVIGSQNCPH